jgi:phage I-like protein
MTPDASSLAALTVELVPPEGESVPTEAHLLLPGPFRANDGRPRDAAAWLLDARIAAALIARAALKATDTLIDYEHQSLNAEWNGQPAPAAGWFNTLEWREGKGLYATGVRWTERARSLIAAREYRYISAVFSYLPITGEVLEIVSVALTNTPALDGLEALVAARRNIQSSDKEINMADEAKEVAALTQERDRLNTEVAALKAANTTLTQERDAAVAKLADIEAKAVEAALAAEKAEHAAVLKAALDEGIVPPAERAIYERMTLADLRQAVDARKPAALLTRQSDGKATNTTALTKEEAALCEKLGVSHDAYLKAKE